MKGFAEGRVPRWLTALLMFGFSLMMLLVLYALGLGWLYYFVTILACLLLWTYLDRQPIDDLGLRLARGWKRSLLVGLAAGALAMLAIGATEVLVGWVILVPPSPAEWAIAGFILSGYVVWQCLVAFGEELVSRGYIQQNLATKVVGSLAVGLSAILFALLHGVDMFAYGLPPILTAIWLTNLTLGGILLGWAFLKTHTLWFPIGFHFAWNFVQYHLLGFEGYGLFTVTNVGLDVLTGGWVGPEAGLIGTVVFLVMLLLVWRFLMRWLGVQPPPASEEKS
jgi:membrane protease YdiL (CAAX protease family)